MDIGMAFHLGDDNAALIAERSCLLPGACLPIIVPIEGLPRENLRSWIVESVTSPMAMRLLAALRIDETIAWRLLDSLPANQHLDQASLLELTIWQSKYLADRSISAEQTALVCLPKKDQRLDIAARRSYAQVARLFLARQRPWYGPVLFSRDRKLLPDLPPDLQCYNRPVLPILLIEDTQLSGRDLEDACARLLIDLHLARLQRGAADWPAWLQPGLLGVAMERIRGRGPSPRAMLRERQQLGAEGLFAIFDGQRRASPDEATAIVAPLVHSRRVIKFASFLDLLRNQVSWQDALRLSYDFDIRRLLDEP